jgi:hypothetical protein
MARTVHEMVLTTGCWHQCVADRRAKNFNPSLTKSRLVVLDSVVQASVENGEPLILLQAFNSEGDHVIAFCSTNRLKFVRGILVWELEDGAVCA